MAETDDSARQPPPSVLLVGAAGVGKFALIAALQPGVASKKAAITACKPLKPESMDVAARSPGRRRAGLKRRIA